MAATRLGFSRKEAGRMYIGKFVDLMEIYKRVYNFETQRMLFKIDDEEEGEEVALLSDL